MLRKVENRPLKARSINVFRFCIQRLNDDGALSPWPQLMKKWNDAHADGDSDQRFTDAAVFARTFSPTRDHIVSPDHDEPW
jgi:hypothetical protein